MKLPSLQTTITDLFINIVRTLETLNIILRDPQNLSVAFTIHFTLHIYSVSLILFLCMMVAFTLYIELHNI